MQSNRLDRLALQYGIGLTRPSPENRELPISDDAKRKVLAALGADITKGGMVKPTEPPKLAAKRVGGTPTRKCFLPKFLEHNRVWGISLQLYELRSARNWGIGDFTDLSAMVDIAAGLGADFIGLNPLHAPFLSDPNRCSPYEPSNRQYLNPLYIAVDRVPGFAVNTALEDILEDLRQTDLVDYVEVARIKTEVLGDVWVRWQQAPEDERARDRDDFHAFVKARGDGLRKHALFEAISFFMVQQGRGAGWQAWPKEYQHHQNAAVAAFERAHADAVRFHMWLQWLAHMQLSEVAKQARSAGLRIGLYLDLAVGEAIDGSATWSEPEVYISKATIGSPPDPFAADGQDWHLAAIRPSAIASGKSSPFRRMLDAAMRYAGAIRIDHAAALRRLFLIPLDSRPADGAYVSYPYTDMLEVLAKSSVEYQCLVIGEDLGIVPEGLHDDLAEAQILSYRILSYERDETSFNPAEIYPALALACISTHDHQTLAGWWRGADIEARSEHAILPPDITEQHFTERKNERKYLIRALRSAGVDPPRGLSVRSRDSRLADLVISAHRFIAKTPSALAAARLADLTGEKRPTNIPGTRDSYPNWRPKLSVPLEALVQVPLVKAVAEAMGRERGDAGS
jgi:4-alpha-glucanotransferase